MVLTTTSRKAKATAQKLTILYDEPQEAEWFRTLHPQLSDADERAITNARTEPGVRDVLAYDRPDIILLDDGIPILVVEETVEVPSGHNVGQRFARIAAAAECGVPTIYFGPYVARKHGGATEGPRYMNVRLFHSLEAMERVTGTAITTINWPVDQQCEVRRDRGKDSDIREYMRTYFELYDGPSQLKQLNKALLSSAIHDRMLRERREFVRQQIRKPEQYDGPPNSVEFMSPSEFIARHRVAYRLPAEVKEIVQYNIGMTYIRSDPYAGMAMLYRYLYIAEHPERRLVLWFPNITEAAWRDAAKNGTRKDVRLFRVTADAILFKDAIVAQQAL